MKNEQKIFIITLVFCSLLVLNLYFFNFFDFYSPNSQLVVGSVLDLQSHIKKWGVDLLHLDEIHARLLLKKGLPVVRVADDELLKKSNNNQIINFASNLLFDLPPSFFETNDKIKRIAKSKPTAKFDSSNQIQSKMRAEGRHQGEKVELDFWQTEPTTSNSRLPQTRTDNTDRKLPNHNFKNEYHQNDRKVIAIYHTHTAENYENKGYNAHANAGDKGDVVKVGRWIEERLSNRYNISVIHSETVHDKTYDRSYIRALETANSIVNNNPELDIIFDIHRDAIGANNKKYVTTNINGQKVAKIMIVVTNNNYGLPHPNWQQNFRFAKRLATKMNDMYPGLLRKVKLISNRRYNQHVHPRALLLEVGGANSTLDEARRSSYLLAEVLAELMAEGL
ncbi:stage II sporulation protein P [Halanaerobacter jeridensis]|uniref:Stage II sporulation protein P n=1 Tax=Halanaerobacter jeridensis TaxID=706427 RepID=A0A938XP58_9FIRM|nr:stage II sporulation protein P [Halanaerobacter jeridensis]MBM7556227.1 stage II sporulation protein P [Halanaerobacter jeridensis]